MGRVLDCEIAEATAEAPTLRTAELVASIWPGHENGCDVCDIYRAELLERKAAGDG